MIKPRIGSSAKSGRKTTAIMARQNIETTTRESLICKFVGLPLLIGESIPGYTSLNWLAQLPVQAIPFTN
jgi:hypothetical protein